MTDNPSVQDDTRCGTIALVGRPNVGKSTLLNRLLGMKLSIVSRRPQTTRHRLLGIHTAGNKQFVYVDTPGLHGNQKRALNRMLNGTAVAALGDVDVIMMVVEPGQWRDDDAMVLRHVQAAERPVVAVVNKVDQLKHKEALLPFMEELAGRHDFAAIIPLSATRGDNVEPVERTLTDWLPQSPFLFPDDHLTDRSERFLVAELVREQLMRMLGEEVPYSTSVVIDAFEADDRLTRIAATIWVEREGQKAIVIGRGGEQLKRIGAQARESIQGLLEVQVHLELWVKVRAGWADDEHALRSLGYDEG